MKEISAEESKLILFDILVYFDKFCRDNNIKYTLHGGTLLGAVRHKGYIPWDDDIDLSMTRINYDKLLSIWKDGRYKLFNVNPEVRYWNSVIRITDPNTEVYFGNSKQSKHGLWLAIVPIENIPDDENAWDKMKKRTLFWIKKCRQKNGIVPIDSGLKGLLERCCFKVVSLSYMNRQFTKVVSRYKNTETKRMMRINVNYEPKVFPSLIYNGYTELEFEGRFFMAVSHYDDFLKIVYGDYMTLPPVEERVAKHNYRAYYKE